MAGPLKLAPNKAYPSIPTVAGTLENHTLVLEAVREALEIHERRSGDAGDSFVRLSELEATGVINIDQSTNIVVAPDDDGAYIRRDGLSPATTGEIDFGAGIWMRPDTAIKWGNTEYLRFQSGLTEGVSAPGGVVVPTSHIMAYVDFEDGVGGNPGTGSDAYLFFGTGSVADSDTIFGSLCGYSGTGNVGYASIKIEEGTAGDADIESAVANNIPYHIEFRYKPDEGAGGNWIYQSMRPSAGLWIASDLYLIWGNGNLQLYVGSGVENPRINQPVSISVGQWYHVAITIDSLGVARVWLDGSFVGSADVSNITWDGNPSPTSWDFLGFNEGRVDNILILRGTALYGAAEQTGGFTPPTIITPASIDDTFIVGDPVSVTHIDGSLIELENGIGINWDDGAGTNVEALVFGPAPIVVGAPLTNLYTTIEPDALPTIETMTVTVNVWVDLNTVANRSAAMVDVSQLTNGEEYFIMVHSLAGNSSASTGGDHLRLLDQSGSPLPSSEGRWSRFTNYGFEWSYYFKAVVNSAGNDFLTQQKSQRTSTRNMGYWDMAIPVGNLPASRWLYSESVSTQVFGESPTALAASITIDTAGDYWIFVNATLDGADPNAQDNAGYVIQLYDGTTAYGLTQDNVEITAGPLAEQYIFGAWIFLQNVQAGTVLTPRMYYEPFKGITNPSVSRSMIAGLNVSEHFVEHYAVTDFNLAFYSAGTTTHSTDNFTVQNSGVMSFFGHAQITESGTGYIEAQKNGGGYTKYSESHRRDSAVANSAQAHRVTPLEGAAGQLSVTAGDVIDVRFITIDGGSGQLGSHSIFSIMMETVDALGNTCVLGDPSYPTRIDGNTTTVTGAAQLDSTLSVTGATTLASTLDVTGATTLASTLDVAGATTLASTLDVAGLATFNGGILGNTPVADTTTPILTLATDVINVDRRLISFLEAGGTEGFYLQADWSEGSPGNWLEFGSTYPQTAGTQIFAIKEDGAFRFDNGLVEYTPGVTLDKGTLTHLGVTTFEIGNTTTANDITRLDVMCLSAAKSMVGLFEDGKGTGVSLLYDGTTNTGYLRGHDANTTGVDILEFPRTSDLLNVFGGEFVLSSQTTEPTFQHFNVAATANLAQTFSAGIDYDWTFTGVTDWNITGITSIQAGTVDADFDAITATSYGGIVEANLLDLAAAETVTGNWVFSGTLTIPQAAVTAHEAALTILESQITDGAILARVAGTETITGAWTFSDELLALSFGEDSSSPASATNAITFDLANGAAFEVTLTENITSITISNPPTTGYHAVMTVKFIQDATGSWTVGGWPAAVKWVGGAAPTITGTATTGTDIVRLETWDAGTTWYGTYDQNFS